MTKLNCQHCGLPEPHTCFRDTPSAGPTSPERETPAAKLPKLEMTLDGTGICESDEYRFRIATFTSKIDAKIFGPLFVAAPETARKLAEVTEALRYAEQILSATECTGEKQLGNGAALDMARAALARAEKEAE